jgi:hypothetical protein
MKTSMRWRMSRLYSNSESDILYNSYNLLISSEAENGIQTPSDSAIMRSIPQVAVGKSRRACLGKIERSNISDGSRQYCEATLTFQPLARDRASCAL